MNAIIEIQPDTEAKESTGLVVIQASSVSTILSADKDDILGKLAARVAAFKADVSTAKGRKEIASVAADVATSKMELLRLGRGLTEEWRKSTDAVRAECKIIEERMDALKAQVRRPLTDFENEEKARVASHESALAAIAPHPDHERLSSIELGAAISVRLEPEARNWQEFHQRALDAQAAAIATLARWRDAAQRREEEAEELDRLRLAEAERNRLEAVRVQAEREKRIAEDARIAAEKRAEQEASAAAERAESERLKAAREAADAMQAVERKAMEAQQRAEAAERARVDAIERAEREKLAAHERAEREKLIAIEAERQRAAKELSDTNIAAERRAADVAHRKRFNNEALTAMVNIGISEDHGKTLIGAIAKGCIPHISIGY